MSNYKETTVTGTSYKRCNQVLIINRLGATPTVKFDEQAVITLDTETIVKGAGEIDLVFDQSQAVPLRDPVTGDLTGEQTTYGDIYATLYSAYIAAALARDAAIPTPTNPGE